jgi:hypothetical protein
MRNPDLEIFLKFVVFVDKNDFGGERFGGQLEPHDDDLFSGFDR